MPPPLFALSIATLVSLTPARHDIRLVDELWGESIDFDGRYDLVAVTVRAINARRAYDIGDEFLRRGTPVVLGGIHPSPNFKEAQVHCTSVVCGEAENLWPALLADAGRGALQPRYDAHDFPPVTDLHDIDYERMFMLSKRGKVNSLKGIPIFFSRGCPYGCKFCSTPDFTGSAYRVRSAASLKKQIEEARRVWFKKTPFGSRRWFQLCDENIDVNKAKTQEMLETICDCNINFTSYCSLNNLEDPKTVQLMVAAGCQMLLVGLESLKPEAQQCYNKTQVNKIEKFKNIIRQCQKAGLCIQGDFLANPQLDTYDDMDAVVKFVHESRFVMPIYSILTPFPGTSLYHEYAQKNLLYDMDWDKYHGVHLVVKASAHDQQEYHEQYLRHWAAMYSWPTIATRVWHNSRKLFTFFMSLIMRVIITKRLKALRAGEL